MIENKSEAEAYWKENLKIIMPLLVVWFVVSFGFGIVFVDVLNNIRIGGYKLGFWFAQQGSIYIFVALIYVYSRKMAKLDRKFGLEDE